MGFLELATERYSCRKFMNIPVAEKDITKILEAGRIAPTAKNNQPFRIFLFNSPESREKLKRITECHYESQTAFLICYDKNELWGRSYDGKTSGDVDCSIVATHMMLEAEDIGVGSTWVMYFDPDAAVRELDLPDNLVPSSILVMGYPAEDATPSPRHNQRRSLDELVTRL